MSVLVSHPLGNPNVRALLRSLEGAGLLSCFQTALAVPRRLAAASWVPSSLRLELARRVFTEVPAAKIRSHPRAEIARIAAQRLNVRFPSQCLSGLASFDRAYEHLDATVARYLGKHADGIRLVYAYEDGALQTFRTAREAHLTAIYELPSTYWRVQHMILAEERMINPAWADTIDDFRDGERKLMRKDEEIRLAHHIVVASHFTKRSVTDHFGGDVPITVIPYGAPPPLVSAPQRRSAAMPLRIAFAGNLRQTKGLSYLHSALARADFPWQLVLAGALPPKSCAALDQLLHHPQCQWLGSLPHGVLMTALTRAHVFVFPSLMEGFGLVILEALAAGLPVIATTNTGAPDCLTEGVDGYIVPIRDAQAITQRLATLYDDEDRRLAMGMAALDKAAEWSWRRYEQQIAGFLTSVMSGHA